MIDLHDGTAADTSPRCFSCGRPFADTTYHVVETPVPKYTLDLEGVNRKDRRTLEAIAKRYGWKIRQPSWKR